MRTIYKARKIEKEFGDSRLSARHEKLVSSLSQGFGGSLTESQWQPHDQKGMYRFFGNPQVTPEKQLCAHKSRIHAQLEGKKRILQLNDTVELDLTGKRNAPHLGSLNYVHRKGMHLHSSLLVDCKGVPMGLLAQTYHPERQLGMGKKSRDEDFETKESYRWKIHLEEGAALARLHPDSEIVYVADREADMIELFQARSETNLHLVIRALHNRKLAHGQGKLFEALDKAPFGKYVWIEATDSRTHQPRLALVEVRFLAVTLQQNRNLQNKSKTKIPLFAILVREVQQDFDIEPILWRLLTTLPISEIDDAIVFAQYYALRWIQERFHFLLKSGGANVENLQLQTTHRLTNAITTYSMAALNALKIHYAAKNQPELSAFDLGVTSQQYQALCFYLNNTRTELRLDPNISPTIEFFTLQLARIIGFKPSKSYPLPGLKILNRALLKLEIITEVFNMHPN